MRGSAYVALVVSLPLVALVASFAGAQSPRHGGRSGRGNLDGGRPMDASAPPSGLSDAAVVGDAVVESPESRRVRAAGEFAEGLTAYRHGDYTAAAAHFAAANDALPDPAPVFNMARSYEGANDVAHAIEAYDRYLTMAPEAPDRPQVVERINMLRAHPADVFVSSDPPGSQIIVDEGAPQRDLTPALLRLQPGHHVLTIDHDGFQRHVQSVDALPGSSQTLSITLLPNGHHPPAANAPHGDPRIIDRRTGTLVSFRISVEGGALRPWDGASLGLDLGATATMFVGRYFATRIRFERLLDPDSVWTTITAEAGYVFPFEDLDFGLFGFVGGGIGWLTPAHYLAHTPVEGTPITGLEARLDWIFHPRLSFGIFYRVTFRNFFIAGTNFEGLNSFGASVSLSF